MCLLSGRKTIVCVYHLRLIVHFMKRLEDFSWEERVEPQRRLQNSFNEEEIGNIKGTFFHLLFSSLSSWIKSKSQSLSKLYQPAISPCLKTSVLLLFPNSILNHGKSFLTIDTKIWRFPLWSFLRNSQLRPRSHQTTYIFIYRSDAKREIFKSVLGELILNCKIDSNPSFHKSTAITV